MTRFGLYGAGTVAKLYAKAAVRGVSGTCIGTFDPDPVAAKATASIAGADRFVSAKALLDAVDAVIICSPTDTHFSAAKLCLEQGKHVLLEKPVAETSEQISILKGIAADNNLVCMPAHNYIYNAQIMRAKRLISEHRFGRLSSFWMMYNIFHSPEERKRYGGVLRAISIHHIYTMIYLIGRPRAVSCLESSPIGESDRAAQSIITCEFPGGLQAMLWMSFAASDPTSDPWSVYVKVLGELGGTNFTWNDAVFEDDGGPAWGFPNYVDSFWEELEFFLGKAINKTTPPLSTLDDATAAMKIVEAAERSIKHKGQLEPIDYDTSFERQPVHKSPTEGLN